MSDSGAANLGRSDWLWTPDLDMHIPCCSQPKGQWRCGNGPLMGDAILTGDCGEHGHQNGRSDTVDWRAINRQQHESGITATHGEDGEPLSENGSIEEIE